MTDTEVGSVYVSVGYKVDNAGLAKAESDAVAMAGRVSNVNWAPPTFKSPVMDLRAAEAAGLNMASSIEKGMVGGLAGASAKMESQMAASMGRMQNNMLASSGSFGQVAAAVGPAGIAAAAFIGGAVVAERAAERCNIALKSVANAECIKQATAAYS